MRTHCPYCSKEVSTASDQRNFKKFGHYWRKSDGRWIQRFRCLRCRKIFTRSTLSPQYRQKKRQKNILVSRAIYAGVSMREIARMLRLNKKTVVRKSNYLSAQAFGELEKQNRSLPRAMEVEFDELETFEHTKCKPVSVPLMVEAKTRRILLIDVAQMPAKGPLARISRKKYGYRADHRPTKIRALLERSRDLISENAHIRSDSNPVYPFLIKSTLPKALHQQILGGRGAITGQGELKKLKFDPIFSLNHTCAMFRAHLARLIRRTWNTTKKIDRLHGHLVIYAVEHNRRLATG